MDSARPADGVLDPRTQIGPRTYSARQANSHREKLAPGQILNVLRIEILIQSFQIESARMAACERHQAHGRAPAQNGSR